MAHQRSFVEKPFEPHGDIHSDVVRLYDELAPGLLSYAVSLARSRDVAHDAVQEAFLRYFIERRSARCIANPRAWLYQVLRNYLLERLNAAPLRREIAGENMDHVADHRQNPEGLLLHSELTREIAATLTGRELDCVRLRTEGLSYAEIAERLDVRSGTVGALLARAFKKLRTSGTGDAASKLTPTAALASDRSA